MRRSLVPLGGQTPAGLFFQNNNINYDEVSLRPLRYVDCALLIRKHENGNPLTLPSGSSDVYVCYTFFFLLQLDVEKNLDQVCN